VAFHPAFIGSKRKGSTMGKGHIGSDDTFKNGLKIRSEIMDADKAGTTFEVNDDFMEPFQRLVGTYCWGEVWSRDEMPRKIRSLLTVVMMAALNRPHELRRHLKGAVNNGCTSEDIREAMLQVAIYCGVPAANEGLRIAREVLAEKGLHKT
jgi:4-carboxymuconolactone decarboxylase